MSAFSVFATFPFPRAIASQDWIDRDTERIKLTNEDQNGNNRYYGLKKHGQVCPYL